MKNLHIPMAVALMVILLGSIPVRAEDAQPGLIYYKGLMADLQGKLIHDTLSVTFAIYDAPVSGNLLWTETHPSMIIWGGVYTVLLGAIEPFPVGIFWDQVGGSVVRKGSDRWLGVTIEGLTELSTRKRISTVAYAINADVVDGRHASEFVSSVHPDSMVGVVSGDEDDCSNTIPMLTVINDCDGGGIKGECVDGTGVIGDGQTGLYGTSDDADGIGIHGLAESPATQAGYFKGNVTVNGETQIGLSRTDYHYLRIPGKDAWGYLNSYDSLNDTNAIDISYNFHVDPSGTEISDNGAVNTAQIRMGHGGIAFRTEKNGNSPKTRMLIDPKGKTTFFSAIAAPRATFDTLFVNDTCYAADKFEALETLGIGTTSPSNYKLHVKGSGNFDAQGLSKGGHHIALFEATHAAGDGIAVKLSSGTPGHNNRFVSFLNSSGGCNGHIEGQANFSDMENYDQDYANEYFFFKYEVASLAIDAAFSLIAFNVCFGVGLAFCPPPPAPIVGTGIMAGVLAGKTIGYREWKKSRIGVSYTSGACDYAEWLERTDEGERMEPGDIVGVCGGKIGKQTHDAQQLLVISNTPIFVGNMPQDDEKHLYERVAFMGQVRVKVIGPVTEGDYIIPSGFNDGTGIAVPSELMTADEFSKVVGRAWSSSMNSNVKYINMAIGLNSRDVAHVFGKQKIKNLELRDRLQRVKTQLAEYDELEQKISRLEGALEKVEGGGNHTLPRDDEK